jgi:DNA topoisomerase III
MKEKGIGTPATRAQIIERLLMYNTVNDKAKSLCLHEKGIYLIQLLQMIPLARAFFSRTHWSWEKKLLEIEKNQLSEKTFKKK